MPGIEDPQQAPQAQGNIMIVDDNPVNLKLLEDMLGRKSYAVRSFPRGRLALAAANQSPPDLVLLDVNMPEMNGYEVCENLKSKGETAEIPVIFLSALSQVSDKIKAFQAGGVDYISKPFQLEEVYARVEVHLKLRRAQLAEQEVLEQTLNGAIKIMMDLVHAASPELATRSRAIRGCVAWMTQQLALSEPWQYDLAATLCLLGCVTLPEEIFKKGYRGELVCPEEEEVFRAHPESAARILLNIPRLEPIAEMIRLQHSAEVDSSSSDQIKMGARMLHMAVELDRCIYRGLSFGTALRELKSVPGRFDPAMLGAVQSYSPLAEKFHHEPLRIPQLCSGMSIEDDVLSETTGAVIFRKGTILTETWIERLGNFARLQGIKQPLWVGVPGPPLAPVVRGAIKR